jgi:hypothetical protein
MEDSYVAAASFMANEANVRGVFERQMNAATCTTRVEKSHSHCVLQRTVQIAENGTDQLRFRLLAEALLPFDTERALDDVQGHSPLGSMRFR